MSDVTIVKPEITETEMPSQDVQPNKKKKKSKDEKIKALQHSANNWQAKYHRVRDELAQVQQERDAAVAQVEVLMERLSKYYR